MLMKVFMNYVFLNRDPSSSHLRISAVYPKTRKCPTTDLSCSIGSRLLLVGNLNTLLVTYALSLCNYVVSFTLPLVSLVVAVILQRGQLMSYLTMSFGVPLT
jgi:hypothetical protein